MAIVFRTTGSDIGTPGRITHWPVAITVISIILSHMTKTVQTISLLRFGTTVIDRSDIRNRSRLRNRHRYIGDGNIGRMLTTDTVNRNIRTTVDVLTFWNAGASIVLHFKECLYVNTSDGVKRNTDWSNDFRYDMFSAFERHRIEIFRWSNSRSLGYVDNRLVTIILGTLRGFVTAIGTLMHQNPRDVCRNGVGILTFLS